jgi:hypothetical protein
VSKENRIKVKSEREKKKKRGKVKESLEVCMYFLPWNWKSAREDLRVRGRESSRFESLVIYFLPAPLLNYELFSRPGGNRKQWRRELY